MSGLLDMFGDAVAIYWWPKSQFLDRGAFSSLFLNLTYLTELQVSKFSIVSRCPVVDLFYEIIFWFLERALFKIDTKLLTLDRSVG